VTGSSTPSIPLDAPANCPVGSISDSTGEKCCDSECEQCGGYGCDLRNGGPEACCVSSITKLCSEGTLPCIADSSNNFDNNDKCPNGGIYANFIYANMCPVEFCCPKRKSLYKIIFQAFILVYLIQLLGMQHEKFL